MVDYITASLNPSQEKAVRHCPDIPLQILAGPGSGKTKVLTSRIAHLILHHRIPPSAICAVTFTNKAANEMKERLSKLIGRDWTYQIKMGTFHALCALFLRRHGTLAGVDSNFTICDADESEKLITKLVKPRLEEWEAKGITVKAKTVMSVISKAKAQGHNPQQYLRFSVAKDGIIPPNPPPPDPLTVMFAEVYTDYQKTLRKSNSLDFDDLLVYGVKLFRGHDKVVSWCRHVLVDEFQDTNTMQYAIMKHLATHHTSVTVVGDPDQSIYGWRSADVANLKKMQKDFSTTEQIFLEENYRSTASILAVSLAIVSKDKTRIPKSLHTSHPHGTIPMLGTFRDEKMEAQFIATETKRLVAASGGMFEWKDFVILLRFNALSRALEAALQKEGIPNRVLNGHKFFERIEIKDLLAYLQTVDNPLFVPAFVRCINTPPRTIGEKSVNEILARAEKDKISPLTLLEGIYDSKMPDIKPAVKRKIGSFVPTIRKLRKLANSGTPPADLIRELLELTAYEGYLKKLFPDWETRWENVQELITFAAQPQETIRMDLDAVEVPQASQSQDQSQSQEQDNIEMYDLEQDGFMVVDEPASEVKGKEKEKPVTTPPKTEQGLLETPLRTFLQASMLSTDSETREDGDKNKVTISTCHAAKGLEWPVVFVPAVEKDIFPFYRTEDTEEERRLLYVACTRAQGLLYISNVVGRMHGGKVKFTQVSEFISAVLKDDLTLTTTQPPAMNYPEVEVISRVLRQPCPSIEDINKRMRE
ncbi:UvrD-helicase-domain-containing protein [Stereum hirsutum FP-91666 SS1]|uniref:UvrD-helicase-domain-containing protein n=1 Tax=Stereum hirsutum (strain FP-91666) TaxID=721885 RepID=UPI000440ECC2|nr:UvrD-helicase-domain-containing protein [Stereum hirsutum FP-91666 SS1]EIM91037.1 UvrD-helicase-domain-containing protein [Stereum hirsutum FP-91666 SS1]